MEFARDVLLTDRIAGLIPRVSDRLIRLSDGIGDGAGLSRVQLQMLDYIYHCGDCTIGALTRAMRRAQSSVSELTDRLEERGLVRRHAPDDRRKTVVRLTTEGKNWVRDKEQRQRDSLQALLHALETDSKEALRDALLSILQTTDRLAS